MKYLKYFENSNTDNTTFKFENDFYDYHHGQSDAKLIMYLPSGEIAAYVDYSLYNNEVYIKYIESTIKNKGYGVILMKHLASLYGYENINYGGLTDGGAVLKKNLDTYFNFDPKEHLREKTKHIKQSDLCKIKNDSVKEFLNKFITDGRKVAWDYLIKTHDFKYNQEINGYDFNDISGLADWIEDSKTNDNYGETIPDYYLDMFNDLIT